MANKRILYATKKAGIGPVGSAGHPAADHPPVEEARALCGIRYRGAGSTAGIEWVHCCGTCADARGAQRIAGRT